MPLASEEITSTAIKLAWEYIGMGLLCFPTNSQKPLLHSFTAVNVKANAKTYSVQHTFFSVLKNWILLFVIKGEKA